MDWKTPDAPNSILMMKTNSESQRNLLTWIINQPILEFWAMTTISVLLQPLTLFSKEECLIHSSYNIIFFTTSLQAWGGIAAQWIEILPSMHAWSPGFSSQNHLKLTEMACALILELIKYREKDHGFRDANNDNKGHQIPSVITKITLQQLTI